MKLSVIVPVYNTGNYLNKCIDSILKQTFQNFELIIVDDGSTDNSLDILRSYEKKHPSKIKVISQENKGQANARNNAISVSKGEFYSFVDSDDWILPTMYEEMINLAENNNYDIVISDTVDHYPTRIVYHHASVFESKYTVTPSAANKIFRKEFVGDIRFAEGLWYEDFCFTTQCLYKTEKIGTIPKPFYNCHCREESTMSNNNSIKNLDILEVLDIIKEFIYSQDDENDKKLIMDYLVFDHVLITTINRVSAQANKDKKIVINKLLSYVKKQNIDFKRTEEYFKIPKKRMVIAKLNYFGLASAGRVILSFVGKLKGH